MKLLVSKIRLGVKFSLFEKGITLFLGLLQLFVVVRNIDEREIGLMALVNTVLMFGNQLFELGIGNSILHRQDSTHHQLSSIYWWQIIMALIITLLILLIAGPFSSIYKAPALRWMLYFLSITILVNSLGQSFSAILYRDLHFVTLSKLRILVTIFGFVTVVVLAVLGWGIWALVLGHFVKSITQTLLLNYQGRKFFSPAWHFVFKEIRPHISFGLYQTGESFILLLNRQLDTLIIGKFLGSEVLGIYDVIKQLLAKVFRLVNSVITGIMLPVFARFQDDKAKVSSLYLRQLRLLSSLNFPFYLFIALNPEIIFLYILNPTWSTPTNQLLLMYLALFFLVASTQNPLGTLLISHGKVRQSFWYNVGVTAILIPSVIWSAAIGIISTTQVLLGLQCTTLIASFFLLLRPLVNFPITVFFYNLAPPFLIGLFSVFFAKTLSGIDLGLPRYITGFIEMVSAIFCYLVLSSFWNKLLWQEIVGLIKREHEE